jgi:hypothetical protein
MKVPFVVERAASGGINQAAARQTPGADTFWGAQLFVDPERCLVNGTILPACDDKRESEVAGTSDNQCMETMWNGILGVRSGTERCVIVVPQPARIADSFFVDWEQLAIEAAA